MGKVKRIPIIIGDNQRKNLNDEFISGDIKPKISVIKKDIEKNDGTKDSLYIVKEKRRIE